MDHSPSPLEVAPAAMVGARRPVWGIERRALRGLLDALGAPPIEVELWTGEVLAGDPAAPAVARVLIKDRGALWRMLANPELYTGDDYTAGRIEVGGDFLAFLTAVTRGLDALPQRSLRARLLEVANRPRANTLAGSRRHIRHHYDLGNEFYRLWLDAAAMQYTCAYFESPQMSLEAAQLAKLDHVARKLELRPGDQVFEAGCGWGGLARHFARHYGVKVRAFNISEEQVRYARERAAAEGLAGQVEYVLDDYRNMSGQCDRFVSVGMLEHVGVANYPVLGEVIARVLKPEGRGLIHTIGRNRPRPMNAWIEKRIFPGACPPSLAQMMGIFEGHAFSVLDVENLRLHYAETLGHWLARFEAQAETVRAMYDPQFVRMWRLYLAGSQAAFLAGALQLFQVVFARTHDNQLPRNRRHLYPEAR